MLYYFYEVESKKKKRNFFPKKEVADRITDLQERNVPLNYEKEVPLTELDRANLKNLLAKVFLIFGVGAFVLAMILLNYYHVEMVAVGSGLLLIFCVVTLFRSSHQIITNLRYGKKTMIRGIITDRYIKKEWSEPDEDGKRSPIERNYLVVGNIEWRVNHLLYNLYRIGEAIEIHAIYNLNRKPYFLHHEKIEQAGMTRSS